MSTTDERPGVDDGSRPLRRALEHRVRRAWRNPETVTDSLQILKCVVATTVGWWLSIRVLHSEMPFMAPWTALLTVHATVYRSLSRGVQTTVASAVGVAVSFAIGSYLGVSVWTFALAILVGLVGARLSWLRDEGVAIATTAVFVLGSGFGHEAPLLDDRLMEVGLGVGIGIAVNLLLVPPLRDQQAASYVDSMNRRMGEVLINMAEQLDESWDTECADAWVDASLSIDSELESAWQTVRFARESERANPRRFLRHRARRRPHDLTKDVGGRSVGYEEILARVGEGISHLRNLARTLRESTYADSRWDDDFRSQWTRIVRDTGRCIQDPDADVEPIDDRIDALARSMAEREMPGTLWPVYGSLITSMRHLATTIDDVASARAARESDESNPTIGQGTG